MKYYSAKIKQSLSLFLIFLFVVSCRNPSTFPGKKAVPGNHSLLTELELLHNINKLPLYIEDTIVAQVSSYDTTGGNDDGFSGKYSFISRNADSSLVLFNVRGSGVINRFWTPTPTSDTLDFYLDDSAKPSFSILYMDLFSGKVFPFIKPLCGNELGGYYCYLPVPFEKSCKIISRGKKTQFHQIQYRLFKPGSSVKSFSPDLSIEEKNVLNKIALQWNKTGRTIYDFVDSSEYSLESKTIEIKPGETKAIFISDQGGRIGGIEFEEAVLFEGPYKLLDIRISWDNEKIPAVYCPLADFFGYSFGEKSMQSLLIGTYKDRCYCYIPMPYDNTAKIEFIYRENNITNKAQKIKIKTRVYFNFAKRDSTKEGKFYTSWNRQFNTEKGKPHVFSEVKGKGHFIGTILQTQGLRPGMTLFFEGDDSTSIDGSACLHGTGSEDYFNGGWYAFMDCWDARISLPLHGSLDYSLPFCRTGGYRFYLADKLSFGKSFYHSIEHGPIGNEVPVDYTSLSFYYCDSPSTTLTPPTNELSRVYIPDTLVIYPQLMSFTIWESFNCRSEWAYNTGGMSYIFTVGNETAIRISLRDIPEGRYDLFTDFEKNSKGCEFSFWQRKTQISEWISSADPGKERFEMQYISELDLNDFKNTLSLKFRTENGNEFFFNRLILIKKSR